ncbi:hypothetical protein FE783_19975 [Paenibacillus mesophilus]|uniref:hypothetical protein n=1 Tax=Paenibacillus mesophilus TaxID=2582849 RepID=UPI00110E9F72|nr:hypothetical protein [Paenibacillus mesophilus]TMV47721.1 hypothetical protein FE783_19975 [Paenibacillus mesophilus]
MKKFDDYPKAFKKMVRYIRQEATIEQIRGMETIFTDTVAWRKLALTPDGEARDRNWSRKPR